LALRPLPESRSSSKKPPGHSAEKMRAGRRAHKKTRQEPMPHGGVSTSGRKKSHGEIQAETGTPSKKIVEEKRRPHRKDQSSRRQPNTEHRAYPCWYTQAAQCSEHRCYAEKQSNRKSRRPLCSRGTRRNLTGRCPVRARKSGNANGERRSGTSENSRAPNFKA
jgi:hypothetical protein